MLHPKAGRRHRQDAGRGAAGQRRCPGPPAGQLPARAVRRPAAAGHDRDGAGLRPGADYRRRAHDRARRDRAGAGAEPARGPGSRGADRDDHDQPRSCRARRLLRPARGDVRRADGGVRARARGHHRRETSLYPAAVPRVPAAWRPGLAAGAGRVARRATVRRPGRLSVRAALPGRDAGMPDRGCAPGCGRRGPRVRLHPGRGPGGRRFPGTPSPSPPPPPRPRRHPRRCWRRAGCG